MLYLITGKPGSFKTAKCATMAIDFLKDGRNVYTNIDSFDYDNVQPLPQSDNWLDTPDGSVVIYDEAQQFDFFKYKGREKLSSDERVAKLETHRHTGHDIILITQSPNFLHNHLLGLVGSHYHLHRAYGRGFADVFLWRYAVMMPDSTGSKNKAESHEKFKPNPKIFEKYKSTTLDTHKLKIPPIYFKLVGFLVAILCFIGYIVFGSNNTFLSAKKIAENVQNTGQPTQTKIVGSQAASVTEDQTDLNFECRKAVNVEKPECVQWFNNLSQNNGSVSGDSSDKTLVTYDPTKPNDLEHIQKQIRYEVTSMPKFSGCTKFGNKYQAYTEQGTKINVSASDCDNLIRNNDRPYDYFKQPTNNDFNTYNNDSINDSNVQTNRQTQTMNYANNEVQPHLQQNLQVNGANTL